MRYATAVLGCPAKLRIPFLLLGLLAPGMVASEPQAGETTASVPWIQAYLEEFSLVLDTDGERKREFIATRLTASENEDTLVLVYERNRYTDLDSAAPDSRQRIHYPFELADLNPMTIEVRSWIAPLSKSSFYIVLISVREEKGFVDYSNIVEERQADGTVDVTSSRGKARTLALGYFSAEENARRLAEATKELLESTRAEDEPVSGPG